MWDEGMASPTVVRWAERWDLLKDERMVDHWAACLARSKEVLMVAWRAENSAAQMEARQVDMKGVHWVVRSAERWA